MPGAPARTLLRATISSAPPEVEGFDDYEQKEDEPPPASAMINTWSAIMARETEKEEEAERLLLYAPDGALTETLWNHWKLLIVVLDCSNNPKLRNPPRSVKTLKARLSAAVGVTDEQQDGDSGLQAQAQYIVTSREGAARRIVENDEDLCSFWENVSEEPYEGKDSDGDMDDPVLGQLNAGKAGRGAGRPGRRGSMDGDSGAGGPGSPVHQEHQRLQPQRAASVPGGQGLSAGAAKLAERCRTMEKELAACTAEKEEIQAELQDVKAELADTETRLIETEAEFEKKQELCECLELEKVQIMKNFRKELEEKYTLVLADQARKVADAEGKSARLEGEIEVQLGKVKALEGSLRQEQAATKHALAQLREAREQCELERRKAAAAARRQKQVEYVAESSRRKVAELTAPRGNRPLQLDSVALPDFRIMGASHKFFDFPKGRMVQSPEFEVPMLGGKLQFEFFPNGDLQAREGWSTFRLHVPDLTHLRWQVHLGGRTYGPRTDTFDKSKWWNRYGLLWLNFCPSAEARSEALPETDSLTCGVEVLEVLAMPDGEEVEPEIDADAKAATDQAAGLAASPHLRAVAAGLKGAYRPGTAPGARFASVAGAARGVPPWGSGAGAARGAPVAASVMTRPSEPGMTSSLSMRNSSKGSNGKLQALKPLGSPGDPANAGLDKTNPLSRSMPGLTH